MSASWHCNRPARRSVYRELTMPIPIRLLLRTPGMAAVAILSIALSVGATAVVFTAIRSVLLTPLPYAHAAGLVQIRTDYSLVNPARADWVSWHDMQDLARDTQTLSSVAVYHYALFNLAGDSSALPEALYGLSVSANLFPTLGVVPMLGRNILPEEDRPGSSAMILSYGLWTRRFQADRAVIGRQVQVNGHACTIIGVMPPDFDFPLRMATPVRTPSRHMDFWAPLAIHPDRMDRHSVGYGAVARLRPGVPLDRARQDLAAVSDALERAYPSTNARRHLGMNLLRDRTLGSAQTGLLLLMAAALMFLLIGCANVANLLLARAMGRNREIAVRMALGAGRVRIARQFLAESCLLGLVGGMAGYGLAVAAWSILPAVAPVSIPRLAAARADWTVFAFALTVSLLNSLAFGMAPALRASRRVPADALREAGAGGSIGGARNRLRSALVIAEVALAVVLTVIGGMLTGSFVRLLRTDPGFHAGRVLASIIVASGDRYLNHPEARALLFRRILASVLARPAQTPPVSSTLCRLAVITTAHGSPLPRPARPGRKRSPSPKSISSAPATWRPWASGSSRAACSAKKRWIRHAMSPSSTIWRPPACGPAETPSAAASASTARRTGRQTGSR